MSYYEFEGKQPEVAPSAFVHPEAVLIGDVYIGEGSYVGAGAVLRGDIGSIVIGAGSNVQENCVLHTLPSKTTYLHDSAHIGHGSILHSCEICSYVLIGMGSVIADDVIIHTECIVGASSMVLFGTQIPSRSMVLGSPAEIKKQINSKHIENIKESLSIYQALAYRNNQSLRKIEL